MCCAFSAQLHTHVTWERHQDPVSCGSSVHFCTSLNHSLEILSITADKCNLCQDFLHTETHSSCSQTLFSFILCHLGSQICDISVSDHARLVAVNERRCLIENRVTTLLPALFGRNCKEIENSALMWLAKFLRPKLWWSRIASSMCILSKHRLISKSY